MKIMQHDTYQKNLVGTPTESLMEIIRQCTDVIRLQSDFNPNIGYYTDEIHYCHAEMRYRQEPKNAPMWRKRLGFGA